MRGQIERRKLVLYPECGVLSEFYQRKTCCDVRVRSDAGRNYCYHDLLHGDDKFHSCEGLGSPNDFFPVFECCDELSDDDMTLAFSCKLNMM